MVQVRAELVQPGAGLVVSSLKGGDAEHVHVAALVVVDGAVHLFQDGRVFGKDVGNLDACNVEGLGGRDAGYGIAHQRLLQGGPGGVVVAGISELAVDFVGNHEHIAAEADLSHAGKLFPGPDAAGGIVGVAQQQHPGFPRLGLEVFPVNGVGAVFVVQGLVQLHALVVADGREKGVVARGLHHHFVAGDGHGLDGGAVGCDNPGGGHDIIPADARPAVPLAEPPGHGLKIAVRHQFIAEHAVVQAALQRFQDFGRGLEVHVGHPHGQLAGELVPLDTLGAAAVYDLVEIIHCG